MDTDLDTLATALYVRVDDALRDHPDLVASVATGSVIVLVASALAVPWNVASPGAWRPTGAASSADSRSSGTRPRGAAGGSASAASASVSWVTSMESKAAAGRHYQNAACTN